MGGVGADSARPADGMFAFALWNDERQELVCARDLFGEKPLYWASDGRRLAFASCVWALLEARPDLGAPRADALAPFLGRGITPPPAESFFAGVDVLPAAHLLHWAGGRVRVTRYWSPNRVDVPSSYDEAAEQLRALLEDSVRLRLRADVPVGTSLSGGVDSSSVVSLVGLLGGASRHAFTASFPGFDRDERSYADGTARAAGVLDHHVVEPTAEGWLADAEKVVRFHEEPFGTTSIYAQWCVMRAAADSNVTVLLDGQGADELLGGYSGTEGWAIRAEGTAAIARGLASAVTRRDVALALGSDWTPRFVRRKHREGQTGPYVTGEVRAAAGAIVPATVEEPSPLRRELLRQTFHTSLPTLLRYADRSSMAFSREVRLPFLDRRVAEYALSLPPTVSVVWAGVRKAVLRDAVRGLVPDEVLARRDKVGFETPQRLAPRARLAGSRRRAAARPGLGRTRFLPSC